jgi:hypothetical protein
VESLKCGVWVLIYTGRDVFIGVQGGVTDLIKSVTRQVVAGRLSHMAARPCGLASTDFLQHLGLPLLVETHVHEAVCQTDIKHSRPARGFGRPATPGPTSQRPLYTTSLCQVHPRGDTYFGGIPNILVIS